LSSPTNRATASTAAWLEPDFSIRSTRALPTTTPSAYRPIWRACSGVETPKPTQTGISQIDRTLRTACSIPSAS
jgi:hypothetical protein